MPFKKGNEKSILLKTAEEYSQVATTHGIYYVFEKSYGWLSQLIWVGISVALITTAVTAIAQLYRQWKDDPVITSVASTGYSISGIEFPAITICGEGAMSSAVTEAFIEQAVSFVVAKKGLVSVENVTWGNITDLPSFFVANNVPYQEFIDELYPGWPRDLDLERAILLLSTSKPDNFVHGITDLLGFRNDGAACLPQDQARRGHANTTELDDLDAEELCGSSEYVLDSNKMICYRLAGKTADVSSATVGADRLCNDLELLLTLEDNRQLANLGALMAKHSGPLNASNGGTLWTDIVRDVATERFYLDNTNFITPSQTKSPYKNLIIQHPLRRREQKCLVLRHMKDKNVFMAGTSDCSSHSEKWAICLKYLHYQRCDDGETPSNDVLDSVLDDLINPEKKLLRFRKSKMMKSQYQLGFRNVDMNKAYSSLFRVLWYSQLPCSDTDFSTDLAFVRGMLQSCNWRGMDMPCDSIFKTFPTDIGMCCAFNYEAADKIYYDTMHRQMVTELQEKLYRRENFYGILSDIRAEDGVNRGLSIVLDAMTDKVAPGTYEGDFHEFKALVSARTDFPMLHQKHILIRPGYKNLIALRATNVFSGPDVQDGLDSSERKCLFGDEKPLHHFREYSQNNCITECKIRRARGRMLRSGSTPCSPWYMPTENNTRHPMCDPWDTDIFRQLIKAVPLSACSECYPDCNSTYYESSVTAVPFKKCSEKNLGMAPLCNIDEPHWMEPKIYAADVRHAYRNLTKRPKYLPHFSNLRWHGGEHDSIFPGQKDYRYDAYEKDIAVATFYFESSTIFQYKRELRMTDLDFLAQVGGLLGLCIGFSVCSAIEILYWCSIRLWRNMLAGNEHQRQSRCQGSNGPHILPAV